MQSPHTLSPQELGLGVSSRLLSQRYGISIKISNEMFSFAFKSIANEFTDDVAGRVFNMILSNF